MKKASETVPKDVRNLVSSAPSPHKDPRPLNAKDELETAEKPDDLEDGEDIHTPALDSQDPHALSGARDNVLEVAIGREVRAFRKKLGITVSDLARATGLSLGMLSKIENGVTSASLTTLQRLSRALGVPVNVPDKPALCSFVMPAIVDRGEVTAGAMVISAGSLAGSLAAGVAIAFLIVGYRTFKRLEPAFAETI